MRISKNGVKMKVSTVGKIILESLFRPKCDSCGKSFAFTLNNDCYVYIPNGRVRVKCHHCGQAHDISLRIEKVKEEE